MTERRAIGLALLLSAIPLLGWWLVGLFDIDEGFYAAVVSEMNRRGEWITPYYNGRPWFEKPILLYWLAKPTQALFGVDFGGRLPGVLATFATAALLAWFARRHFGKTAAILAPIIFGTSLLPIAVGRLMMTDPPFVLAMTLGLLLFWESLVGSPRWRWGAGAALGVAMLAKGPVAGALFLPIAAYAYWRMPTIRPGLRGGWAVGLGLFAAVVALWYLPAWLVNREVFVQKFLIEQNLQRFTGGDEAHTLDGFVRWIFYLPILLLGFLPWVFWLPKAWPRPSSDDAVRYVGVCAAWILIFFTVSAAKLPHYILPAWPFLALVVAAYLGERWETVTTRRWVWMGALTAGMFALANYGFTLYYHGGTIFGAQVPGFHAELHRLTRYAKEHAAPDDRFGEYQMSRQDRELGTGKIKIQETSHPSVLAYLNSTVIDADRFEEFLEEPGPIWILTRWNRISLDDFEKARAAGRQFEQVDTPFEQDLYRLYRLEAKDSDAGPN